MNVVAECTVRCGEDVHHVGVTARGQAVMLDHDRSLERLAVGIEREARTPCARIYDLLREALAGAAFGTSGTGTPFAQMAEAADSVDDYLAGSARIRTGRAKHAAHNTRLVSVSVLAGGPPHLTSWDRTPPPHPARLPQHRARPRVIERIVPQLFLRAGYPIVARHPQAGPGVTRGACWHITVADLSPTDDFPVATLPHPLGRGRVCLSVTVPLSPTWYRDVYKEGLAFLEGELVVSRGLRTGAGGNPHRVTVLRQHGARFRLADGLVERRPAGWRLLRVPSGPLAVGTGARPSPWD